MLGDLTGAPAALRRAGVSWAGGRSQYSGSLRLGSLGLVEEAVHFCNLLLVFDFSLKERGVKPEH
jgi:hypothetical protein